MRFWFQLSRLCFGYVPWYTVYFISCSFFWCFISYSENRRKFKIAFFERSSLVKHKIYQQQLSNRQFSLCVWYSKFLGSIILFLCDSVKYLVKYIGMNQKKINSWLTWQELAQWEVFWLYIFNGKLTSHTINTNTNWFSAEVCKIFEFFLSTWWFILRFWFGIKILKFYFFRENLTG